MLTKARVDYLSSIDKDELYFRTKIDALHFLIKRAKGKLNHPEKYEEETDKAFTEEEREGLLSYVNFATGELKMLKRNLPANLTFYGTHYRCNSCGHTLGIGQPWNYCPRCGHRWRKK